MATKPQLTCSSRGKMRVIESGPAIWWSAGQLPPGTPDRGARRPHRGLLARRTRAVRSPCHVEGLGVLGRYRLDVPVILLAENCITKGWITSSRALQGPFVMQFSARGPPKRPTAHSPAAQGAAEKSRSPRESNSSATRKEGAFGHRVSLWLPKGVGTFGRRLPKGVGTFGRRAPLAGA